MVWSPIKASIRAALQLFLSLGRMAPVFKVSKRLHLCKARTSWFVDKAIPPPTPKQLWPNKGETHWSSEKRKWNKTASLIGYFWRITQPCSNAHYPQALTSAFYTFFQSGGYHWWALQCPKQSRHNFVPTPPHLQSMAGWNAHSVHWSWGSNYNCFLFFPPSLFTKVVVFLGWHLPYFASIAQ